MYELISDAHALIVDPVVSHADEAEPVDPEQLYIEERGLIESLCFNYYPRSATRTEVRSQAPKP